MTDEVWRWVGGHPGLKAVIPGPAWFVLSRLGPRAYARYARRLGLDHVSDPA